MLVCKAYKFCIKAKPEQEELLCLFSGCCRFTWNYFLALNLERLKNHHNLLWYQEMSWHLTLRKQGDEYSFLREAPAQALQQTLKNLDRAFKDGFDKKQPLKRIPLYKKKGVHNSFLYPQGFRVDGNRVFLPKIGWMKFYQSRKIAGIDMGIARFATLSDGTFFEPLNSFRTLEVKLAKEQRKLARKVKYSANWKKQKNRITRLHIKIADARNDYLHKTSTTISKNHAVVVLEDLRVRNMASSAKGTVDSPGRNVKAKSGLNKSILDRGWFEFRRQLEYKQAWRGGMVVAVPPRNTSRTCPVCEFISADNRKTQSVFKCQRCGYRRNVDMVAAQNILAAGHVVAACGELALPDSMKQEPGQNCKELALQIAS